MRGEKSRILVGYVLLLLALLGAILTLSTLNKQPTDQSQIQGFQQDFCGARISYSKPSVLYNVEKNTASPRASAYDVVLSNQDQMRVLFDYSTTTESADVKVQLTNSMDRSVNLSDAKFNISTDHAMQSQTIKDLKLAAGESKLVEFHLDLTKSPMSDIETAFTLSNSNCLIAIPKFAALSRTDQMDGFMPGISSNDESRIVKLNPGLNYLGFSDVRLTSNLDAQGVGVYSFDNAENGWAKVDAMKPGLGYVVYSTNPKPKDVTFNNPFYTEQNDQSRTVKPGWNLMYNNFGRDVSLNDYTVSFWQNSGSSQLYDADPVSLASLKQNHLVSDKIYLAGSNGLLPDDSNIIPDTSVFWVYVFAEPPKLELKPVGLDFELQGVGDTYSPGQSINFDFEVVNLDNIVHDVVAAGVDDPCSYGLKITDPSGNIIQDDLLNRTCPEWPATVALQPKQKIDYNYLWKVPDSASGEYKVEAYFDNFRGTLGDPVLKESLINIK